MGEEKRNEPMPDELRQEEIFDSNMEVIRKRMEFIEKRLVEMSGTLPPSYEREIVPILKQFVEMYQGVENTLISNFLVSALKLLLVGPSAMYDIAMIVEIMLSDQRPLFMDMSAAFRSATMERGQRLRGFAFMVDPEDAKNCATCPKQDDCPGCAGEGADPVEMPKEA